MKTFPVRVVQYMMPDGRKVEQTTDIPVDFIESYADMTERGLRFGAEMLPTGQVSLTVENPTMGTDLDIEIVHNGPEVQIAIVSMLARRQWRNYADKEGVDA